MAQILVPGLVVYDHINIFHNHIKVEVVSEDEWKQYANEKYGQWNHAHVRCTTTITPSEDHYNMGWVTKEEFEANVPIVLVEYQKWYLPNTNKELYDHLIAISK